MDCIWTEVYVTIYIQKGIAVLEIVNKLLSLSYCLIISEHVPDSVRLWPWQPCLGSAWQLAPYQDWHLRSLTFSSLLHVLHRGNEGDCFRAPWSIALVPMLCGWNLKFSYRVPFAKEKMPWCPCPFKNQSIHAWIVFTFFFLESIGPYYRKQIWQHFTRYP